MPIARLETTDPNREVTAISIPEPEDTPGRRLNDIEHDGRRYVFSHTVVDRSGKTQYYVFTDRGAVVTA